MTSPTDVRLVAQVELIAQKSMCEIFVRDSHSTDVLLSAQIYETLSPLNGQVNHNTLAFIRRANVALDKWWQYWDELHRKFAPCHLIHATI